MKYELARKLLEEALRYAGDQGWSAAASVVDAGGHLVAFGRNDGASFVSSDVTTRKAFTSAALGIPTVALAAFAKADPAVGADLQKQAQLCTVAGGIPVQLGGVLAGGLGIAGGTGEQDHAVAEHTLRKVLTGP